MDQSSIKIVLVRIGSLDSDLLEWCKKQLRGNFNSDVKIADKLPLSDRGFNKTRNQYIGDVVLDELRSVNMKADRIVGLIDRDCYTQGLNFIFGLASSGGKHAIVALPRLRQSFYGQSEDTELFRQRVLKEIVHELGHTWNLPHCPNPKCVMHFSNSLSDTDLKGFKFCEICSKKLNLKSKI